MASANAQVTSMLRVLADALDSLPGLPPAHAGTYQDGNGFVQFSPFADVSDVTRMVAVDSLLAVFGAADPAKSTEGGPGWSPRYGGTSHLATGARIDIYAPNCSVEVAKTGTAAVTK